MRNAVGWAGRIGAEPYAMAIEVFDVELTNSPRKVHRGLFYMCAALLQLHIEGVDILDEDAHPHSGLPLPILAEEDTEISRHSGSKCRWIAPVPATLEAKNLGVVSDAGGHVANA